MNRKFMKKSLALVLCLSSAFMLTSCKENVGTSEDNPVIEEVVVDESPKYSFGFSGIDMDNPYFETLESVIREGLEDVGHLLITKDPKNDNELQEEQLLSFIEAQVDAIFVAPVDWVLIQDAIDALNEAGIRVINIDTQVKNYDSVELFIGSNNTEAGKQAGLELMSLYPNGGKIAVMESGNINSINYRITGFEEAVSKGGFEVRTRIQGDGSRENAKEKVAELIKKETSLEVIVCGNDQMALGAYDAITEAGLNIKILGIDGSPKIKSLIKAGDELILGTIAQSPITIGKTAVSLSLELLNGEKVSKTNNIETFLINESNVEIYGTESWQ